MAVATPTFTPLMSARAQQRSPSRSEHIGQRLHRCGHAQVAEGLRREQHRKHLAAGGRSAAPFLGGSRPAWPAQPASSQQAPPRPTGETAAASASAAASSARCGYGLTLGIEVPEPEEEEEAAEEEGEEEEAERGDHWGQARRPAVIFERKEEGEEKEGGEGGGQGGGTERGAGAARCGDGRGGGASCVAKRCGAGGWWQKMHVQHAATEVKLERLRREQAERTKEQTGLVLATAARRGSGRDGGGGRGGGGNDGAVRPGEGFRRLHGQAELLRQRREAEARRAHGDEERGRRAAHLKQLGLSARSAGEACRSPPPPDAPQMHPQAHERLYALAPESTARRREARAALEQAELAPSQRWDGEARPLGQPLVNPPTALTASGDGAAPASENGPSAFERLYRQAGDRLGRLRSTTHTDECDAVTGRLSAPGSLEASTAAWTARLVEAQACHRAYNRGMELKWRREQRAEALLHDAYGGPPMRSAALSAADPNSVGAQLYEVRGWPEVVSPAFSSTAG